MEEENMKKQWLIMGLLIMSVLAFTACGKKQEEAAKTVESAEEAVSETIGKQEEILDEVTGEMDLTGSWQDEVSQRATMDIEKAETGTYHILIHWGSSAKEASTWEISGTYDETAGMLTYDNGEYCVHTWDDEDKETISGEEITSGALMKEGDKLRWQDSKNSTDAVFVRVE